MKYRIYAFSAYISSICEDDTLQYNMTVRDVAYKYGYIDYEIFSKNALELDYEDIVYPIENIKKQYKMTFLRLQGV